LNKIKVYFNLAKEISRLSKDKHTKHGCLAISKDGTILSMGYNGPPRGVNDDIIDYERPGKYIFMEHAERNCIYNAAREGVSLLGCIFYITGIPCVDCTRAMFQAGASKICYLNFKSFCTDESTQKLLDLLYPYLNIEVYDYSNYERID
jgi:dCMP deaminase